MIRVRESQYSTIENKIVTLEGVSRLAHLVDEEFKRSRKNEHHSRISFSAVCADDSSFETEDAALFDSGSILGDKKVSSVSILYHDFDNDSDISIRFYHGSYSGSSFKISGRDSNWVSGIAKRLADIIGGFSPQNTFVKRHHLSTTLLFSLGIGAIIMNLIALIPVEPSPNPPQWAVSLRAAYEAVPLLRVLIKYFIGTVIGIFWADGITERLIELWPSIELQIGPEHTFLERKRRNFLITVGLVIVLPLLVSVFKDILFGN
jgi:hypothetical protein